MVNWLSIVVDDFGVMADGVRSGEDVDSPGSFLLLDILSCDIMVGGMVAVDRTFAIVGNTDGSPVLEDVFNCVGCVVGTS